MKNPACQSRMKSNPEPGLQTVSAGEIGVARSLDAWFGSSAPQRLEVLGDPALLRGDKLGGVLLDPLPR